MRWEAPTLIEFARSAGFARDQLPTVAACALASSGGNDRYDFSPGSPGCGRYVGLWAIDVDRWPDWAAGNLHDPHEAARAAYELTDTYGNLRWCPAWASDQYLHWFDHCTEAMSTHPYQERQYVSTGADVHHVRAAQLLDRIARSHNR